VVGPPVHVHTVHTLDNLALSVIHYDENKCSRGNAGAVVLCIDKYKRLLKTRVAMSSCT